MFAGTFKRPSPCDPCSALLRVADKGGAPFFRLGEGAWRPSAAGWHCRVSQVASATSGTSGWRLEPGRSRRGGLFDRISGKLGSGTVAIGSGAKHGVERTYFRFRCTFEDISWVIARAIMP